MSQLTQIARLSLGLAPLAGIACVPPGDGVPPPAEEIYFPVSLDVSSQGRYLLVVNSDFDLKYSQGTIQSLDIARIVELAQTPCSRDSDCGGGETCDTEPSDANDGSPSFTCVGSSGIPCEGAGEKSSRDLSYAPGRCAPVELDDPYDGGDSLIIDVAETSAFATEGLLLQRPCVSEDELSACPPDASIDDRVVDEDGTSHAERLFVPVRGDTTVHYLDLDADGSFVCGRASERDTGATQDQLRRCSSAYRLSEGVTFAQSGAGELTTTGRPPDPSIEDGARPDPGDPVAAFRLPPEPLDLAASDDGRVIAVTHQLGGYVSTIVNPWNRHPSLVHIAEGLPANPIGIAALSNEVGPTGAQQQPGFLVSFRSTPRIDLLRFVDDGLLAAVSPAGPTEEQPDQVSRVYRPELVDLGNTEITLNTAGFHSRGVAVDDRRRRTAIEACGADEDCIETAAEVPLDVYVANRTPSSLLVGRTGGEDPEALLSALPQFYDNVPLSAGPSRVVLGHVTNPDGATEPRVFVLCFDSALIYIYDPARRAVEAEIRTGRGPYAMAFDTDSSLAFIGHFTDSYIGVISLDQRHPMTFGATMATLGDPEPPRASQ